MSKLFDLISRKEEALQELESEEFLNWNKELESLLGQVSERSMLLVDIKSILRSLRHVPLPELALRLKIKLGVFLKYQMSPVEDPMKTLIELINLKENIFFRKDLKSIGERQYYFSEKAIVWGEEVYYLFGQIENKDLFISDLLDLSNTIRVSATPNNVNELNSKLDLFLENKDKYKISQKLFLLYKELSPIASVNRDKAFIGSIK